jgi:hypothetical protein
MAILEKHTEFLEKHTEFLKNHRAILKRLPGTMHLCVSGMHCGG